MSVPPINGTAYTFYIGLTSQADTDIFQANPTLAAGDFKSSQDEGANFANLATLPVEVAGNTKVVKVDLSGGEMTPSAGETIVVIWSDAAGDEWQDGMATITVGARDVDDIPTAVQNVNEWETQSQADPTGFHVNVLEVGGTSQTANDNGADITAILTDTNELQGDDVPGLIDALNDVSVTDITQRQIPDSVPADGTRPTIEQALYMITQYLYERSVSATTVTVKKVDGSTGLMTLTLDDGTDPTSITRAT